MKARVHHCSGYLLLGEMLCVGSMDAMADYVTAPASSVELRGDVGGSPIVWKKTQVTYGSFSGYRFRAKHRPRCMPVACPPAWGKSTGNITRSRHAVRKPRRRPRDCTWRMQKERP